MFEIPTYCFKGVEEKSSFLVSEPAGFFRRFPDIFQKIDEATVMQILPIVWKHYHIDVHVVHTFFTIIKETAFQNWTAFIQITEYLNLKRKNCKKNFVDDLNQSRGWMKTKICCCKTIGSIWYIMKSLKPKRVMHRS